MSRHDQAQAARRHPAAPVQITPAYPPIIGATDLAGLPPASSLSSSLNELGETADLVRGSVVNLEERLSTVLTRPGNEAPNNPRAMGSCAASEHARTINDHLLATLARLNDLIDRIGL